MAWLMVVVLPGPFRRAETQQSGHSSRSGPEVKNGSGTKTARRRDSDTGQYRRWIRSCRWCPPCKKNSPSREESCLIESFYFNCFGSHFNQIVSGSLKLISARWRHFFGIRVRFSRKRQNGYLCEIVFQGSENTCSLQPALKTLYLAFNLHSNYMLRTLISINLLFIKS